MVMALWSRLFMTTHPEKDQRRPGLILERRDTSTYPAPLAIAPSQSWYRALSAFNSSIFVTEIEDKANVNTERDGNDGPWSTFFLGFGTPPQYTRILVSTTAPQAWVVVPAGCTSQDPPDCRLKRGDIFRSNESSTWQDRGNFKLQFEQNLGIDENGNFGLDTVTLGVPGSRAPTLEGQIMAGIAAKQFYIATWGIRPATTNLTDMNHPIESLISNLKARKKIASLAWGYTAGAYYQNQANKEGLGSLTLGGYDAARFEPNNISFPFATDTSRDLLVGLLSVTVNSNNRSLLPKPILAFVDAGVPDIWLPAESCQAFESAFNLTWNSTLERYLVSDTAHSSLVSVNPTVAFTFGSDLTKSGSAVTINFPYGAFDLILTDHYPNITTPTRYFPLRRAANSTQYTLGRAFFQQAYLIADYERLTFSIHQARFPSASTQDLRAILPLSADASSPPDTLESNNRSSSVSAGVIAGIAVAAVCVLAVLGFLLFWLRRRRRHRQQRPTSRSSNARFEKPELHNDDKSFPGELHAFTKLPPELESPEKHEVDAGEAGIEMETPLEPKGKEMWGGEVGRELPGSPTTAELEGEGTVFDMRVEQKGKA